MFELTNEERLSVGLEAIEPHWQKQAVGDVQTYFDGDVLRKYYLVREDSYLEVDIELKCRDRQMILPKTGKGKERKLTSGVLLVKEISNGKGLQVSFPKKPEHSTGITFFNGRNVRHLAFVGYGTIFGYGDIRDYSGLRSWLSWLRQNLTDDERADIEEVRSSVRQQVKCRPGDVFRFQFERGSFGFALIVGCLKEMRKWGVLADDHPLNSVMTVPLIVRPLRYQSAGRLPPVAELEAAELMAPRLMMDGEIFWGQFPIVHHMPLKPEHVDFPMGLGVSTGRDKFNYFYWGFGLHKNFRAFRHLAGDHLDGIAIGQLRRLEIKAELSGEKTSSIWDLRHVDHAKSRQKIFATIGYKGPENYADYAEWAGCLTPEQYIERLRR